MSDPLARVIPTPGNDELDRLAEEQERGVIPLHRPEQRHAAGRHRLYTLEELQTFVGAGEDYIIGGGVLTRGGKLMLVGKAGLGKTTTLDYLAGSIASGKPFLGTFTIDRPRKVLVVQAELAESELASHGQMMWDAYRDTDAGKNLVFWLHKQMKLPRMADELIQTVREVGAEVVAIDPFYRFFDGDNSDKPEQVDKVFAVFDRLLEEVPGVEGVIVVHHENVAGKRTAGSWAFEGWPSTILRIEKVEGVPTDRFVWFEKIRAPGQPLPDKMQFHLGEAGYEPADPVPDAINAGVESVCLVLKGEHGQASRQKVVKVLQDKYRMSARTAARHLAEAKQAGKVQSVKTGREVIYRLADPSAPIDEMAAAAQASLADAIPF